MYQNHPSIRVNNDDEGYVFYSLEPSIICLLFVIITRVKLVLSRVFFERQQVRGLISSTPFPRIYLYRIDREIIARNPIEHGCKNGYEHALCAEVRIKFSYPEPGVS